MEKIVRKGDLMGIFPDHTITKVNATKTKIEGKLAAALGDGGEGFGGVFWYIVSGVSSKITVEGKPLALDGCKTQTGITVHASTVKTTAN